MEPIDEGGNRSYDEEIIVGEGDGDALAIGCEFL